MRRNILLQKLSHYASFEGIEVICVFDAQYMPGVRQTYEMSSMFRWSLPVRMRRQMTISSAWRQSSNAPPPSIRSDQWLKWAMDRLCSRSSSGICRELENGSQSSKETSIRRSEWSTIKTTHATARSPSIAIITRNDGRQVMTFAILTDSTADLDQNWAKGTSGDHSWFDHWVRWDGLPDSRPSSIDQPWAFEAMKKWGQTDNQSGQCGPISGNL